MNNLRSRNTRIVGSSTLWNAGLAIVVDTPSPYIILFVDSERVVGASGNILELALELHELMREKSLCLVTLSEATTELMLLAGAPSECVTSPIQSEDMIRAAGNLGNVLQAQDKDWAALDLWCLDGFAIGSSEKAKDTFVGLYVISNCL